jgi:hypothetical protein
VRAGRVRLPGLPSLDPRRAAPPAPTTVEEADTSWGGHWGSGGNREAGILNRPALDVIPDPSIPTAGHHRESGR